MIEHRPVIMQGSKRYLQIELFGVDAAYGSSGAGTTLLERCCEIADREGLEVSVEANGSAKGFYERFGFGLRAEVVLVPGEFDYRECMMVREKAGSKVE